MLEFNTLLTGYSVFTSLMANHPTAMTDIAASGAFVNFVTELSHNFMGFLLLLVFLFFSGLLVYIITFTMFNKILMPLIRNVALLR